MPDVVHHDISDESRESPPASQDAYKLYPTAKTVHKLNPLMSINEDLFRARFGGAPQDWIRRKASFKNIENGDERYRQIRWMRLAAGVVSGFTAFTSYRTATRFMLCYRTVATGFLTHAYIDGVRWFSEFCRPLNLEEFEGTSAELIRRQGQDTGFGGSARRTLDLKRRSLDSANAIPYETSHSLSHGSRFVHGWAVVAPTAVGLGFFLMVFNNANKLKALGNGSLIGIGIGAALWLTVDGYERIRAYYTRRKFLRDKYDALWEKAYFSPDILQARWKQQAFDSTEEKEYLRGLLRVHYPNYYWGITLYTKFDDSKSNVQADTALSTRGVGESSEEPDSSASGSLLQADTMKS